MMNFQQQINPLYSIVEFSRLNISPARICIISSQHILDNKYNPLYHTPFGKVFIASLEIIERITRKYSKPEFGIESTIVNGKTYKVEQQLLLSKTFCNLLRFKKIGIKEKQPKLLVFAPMSGHHATLLKGTVESFLKHFDVYITDWIDANQVPLNGGSFDLDDFIDYSIDFMNFLGPNLHIIAVCQPTVPVLAAVSIMSAEKDAHILPNSMILMGGPIDARKNPTSVNHLATSHDIEWFNKNLITTVPINYPGFGRKVYPGFLQLAGFISMNWKNHLNSHIDLFKQLMIEDDDKADKQKEFYDEYLSVMDMPAEFYLQTIKEVFQNYSLARDKLISRQRIVDASNIKNVAILGIEGENDDISGIGQTKAALEMCDRVPNEYKQYYLQKNVGHYGVFSGSKFREFVVPVIKDFVYKWNKK